MILSKLKERVKATKMNIDESKAREENIMRDAKKIENQSYYEKRREVAINQAKQKGIEKAKGNNSVGSFVKKYIDQPNKKGFVTKNKPYVMPNIFGSNSGGNSAQIPNLFGGNKGKEKDYKMPKIF